MTFTIEKLQGTKETTHRFSPLLPTHPAAVCFLGRVRSGKTTAVARPFPFRSLYGDGKFVYLISPTAMLQKEVWRDIVGIPDENMFLHYDEHILANILKEAEQDDSEKKIPPAPDSG